MTSDSSEYKTFLQVGSTDCYEDQSVRETEDYYRFTPWFYTSREDDKQHAATGWWFGRGGKLISVGSLGDMTECLHKGHKDLHYAKIPEGGRTGRVVSITVLLRNKENFTHSKDKHAHLNPDHRKSTAVRLTKYLSYKVSLCSRISRLHKTKLHKTTA